MTVWDLRTREQLADGLADSADDLGAWFVDGRTVAAVGSAGAVAVSDLLGWPFTLASRVPADGDVLDAAYSPDGSLLAVADDGGTIRFLDARSLRPSGASIPTRFETVELAFSSDGRRLIAQGGATRIDVEGRESFATIRQTWDVAERRELGEAVEADHFELVRFSPSGSAVAIETGLDDTALRRLGEDGRRCGSKRARPPRTFRSIQRTVRPCWRLLGDGIWDIESGRRVSRLFPEGPAAWTRDGTTVATGRSTIGLWGAESGTRLATLHGTGSVRDMGFSPDGAVLVAAGDDGLAVWDVPRRALLGGRRLAEASFRALDIAPDGGSVVTIDANNDVLLWNLDPETWIPLACRLAGRRVTKSEWTQFVGTRGYASAC